MRGFYHRHYACGDWSMGVVFRERCSLVIGKMHDTTPDDYSDEETTVKHVRLFGLVFAFASWRD